MSPISDISYKPQPVWRLLALFIILCVLFITLRFDAGSYLRDRIAGLAAESGVDLRFDQLSVSGIGARLDHVTVRAPRLPGPLKFGHLIVSPQLGSLLTGEPAAAIEGEWHGVQAEMVAALQGGGVTLSDIHGSAAAADLLAIAGPYLHMPAKLALEGNVSLDGSMALDGGGVPHRGTLNLVWQDAKGSALGMEVVLGEVRMQLLDGKTGWQWSVATAGSGLIQGQGVAVPSEALIGRWPLSGNIEINLAAVNDPALLALVPKQQQEKKLRLMVSGTLSSPRLDYAK